MSEASEKTATFPCIFVPENQHLASSRKRLCDIAYTSVKDAKKVYAMEEGNELLPDGVRKSTPGDTTALAIGNATKRESFHSVEIRLR